MVASQSPSLANPEDFIWLTAPRLMAFAFNWFLFGALTVQLYTYHISFRDRWLFKGLVYGVYLLDVVQTGSATYDALMWFAVRWGDTYAIDNLYTDWFNVPLLTSLIGVPVQLFFGWRIWCFSKSKILYALIIILGVLQVAAAIATSYYLINNPREGANVPALPKTVGIRLGSSSLVDIIIAGCMSYYLLRSRSEFSMKSDKVITKLVRLIIETGTITAVAAILDLVFFVSLHHNAMHQITGVTLSKLYTNSLLVLFNNRLLVKNMMPSIQTTGIPSTIVSARTGSSSTEPPPTPTKQQLWAFGNAGGRLQRQEEDMSLETFEARTVQTMREDV